MDLNAQMMALGAQLIERLEMPRAEALYLPQPAADDAFRDEFGFLFLADGSAAPFYVSLPGTLDALRARFPQPARTRLDLDECLRGLADTALPARALALGAWNALGQSLFRRAGFEFPPRGGDCGPRPGERVGMVGYFRPIVDRLVAGGVEVLVVEQQPARVPARDGVILTTDAAALDACRIVYCSASTLVNASLDDILRHCRGAEAVDLIGPSGSGLPDLLFARGIHAVGGVAFGDANALRMALARGESWGAVGRKYELTPACYPGVEALLAAAGIG